MSPLVCRRRRDRSAHRVDVYVKVALLLGIALTACDSGSPPRSGGATPNETPISPVSDPTRTNRESTQPDEIPAPAAPTTGSAASTIDATADQPFESTSPKRQDSALPPTPLGSASCGEQIVGPATSIGIVTVAVDVDDGGNDVSVTLRNDTARDVVVVGPDLLVRLNESGQIDTFGEGGMVEETFPIKPGDSTTFRLLGGVRDIAGGSVATMPCGVDFDDPRDPPVIASGSYAFVLPLRLRTGETYATEPVTLMIDDSGAVETP